jgi:hypothetical protein
MEGEQDPMDEGEGTAEQHDEGCCCCNALDCELSADDLGLLALCTGAASIFMAMSCGWTRLLGLLCAATGLVSGYLAQKAAGRREKQAIAGMVCGSIGLCFWLLTSGACGR